MKACFQNWWAFSLTTHSERQSLPQPGLEQPSLFCVRAQDTPVLSTSTDLSAPLHTLLFLRHIQPLLFLLVQSLAAGSQLLGLVLNLWAFILDWESAATQSSAAAPGQADPFMPSQVQPKTALGKQAYPAPFSLVPHWPPNTYTHSRGDATAQASANTGVLGLNPANATGATSYP